MQVLANLQFRSNTIYQYNQFIDNPKRLISQQLLKENLRNSETYSGLLKPGAKKRLTKAIELLVMSTKDRKIKNPVTGKNQLFRLSFLTLTIYSTDRNISGKEAHKKTLAPFLQWMRRKHNCLLYVWKAELQARGQIHYHLTSDCFIPYKEILNKWNELQRSAGYLDSFYKKYNHWKPNSIDIHSVKKVKNLSGYLIKEVTKNLQNAESIGGKVWDCSQNLKSGSYFTTVADSDYCGRINELIDEGKIEPVYTDHCIIFKMINAQAANVLSKNDRDLYDQKMNEIRTKEIEIIKKVKKEPQNFNYLDSIRLKNKVDFIPIPDLFSPN